MTTNIRSLNGDLLYLIRSKCSSSIDMWHLLLALDYPLSAMIDLRAFWVHIRLTSMHTKDVLLSFVRKIGEYCIDLRIDNLNWMTVADLRSILSKFRSVVYFHSGNVVLSKALLTNDIPTLFPFTRHMSLLIAWDTAAFEEIWTTLNQIQQLEYLSLVLQDKKGGCLSHLNLRLYVCLMSKCILNLPDRYKLFSVEENQYGIKHRILLSDIPEETSFDPINLSLNSTLKHFIFSFRSILNVELTLELKDPSINKLPLQTLVLPCLPSTSDSLDILDLRQLTILDIGCIDVQNRMELAQLDDMLVSHSLRNLSIYLNEWQSTRLVVLRKEQKSTKFSSVFEDIFDEINTSDNEIEQPTSSSDIIDGFSLEFFNQNQLTIFQLPLDYSWLNKLTNLNLTGIHCHSIDFQYIFDSLHRIQSLSLSPCLLIYLNQMECSCQTVSIPYQCHSLNRNLLSLNLVSHLSNCKDSCPMLVEQYKLHCIRHSSIHQHLNPNKFSFQYERLIRYSIRRILSTMDLHHFSLRIPNYDLHMEDLDIPNTNHLQSLVLDVKIPVGFHTKLARLYTNNCFDYLRRFILINENNFELTPILIDRFRSLEIIEIISINCHLKRATIHYLETALKPAKYPNLTTFRLWVGSVDAQHLIKYARRVIRTAFEKVKPAFQFDISTVISTSQCILYDYTHEIHRDFHSLPSMYSHQLSIVYPKFLNYKSLYSEQKFDK